MAPTATKEGEMTKEEEAKALKVEKRKKGEASKKEDKEKEPSAKMAKKEEKPEPVSIYQTILAMERKESEVISDPNVNLLHELIANVGAWR